MTRLPESMFKEIVDIVYRESGIVLSDKRELLEARLASLTRKKGYGGPKDIVDRLRKDTTGEALVELLDQVSTNLTFFFREPAHFDFMTRTLLPELVAQKKARRNHRIRIWSAACSSGEEPYSIAMVIRDFLGQETGWDIKILATDISTKVLRKAILGRYTKQEVIKAPSTLVQRYFTRGGDRHTPTFEVGDDIKRIVSFRRLNLLQDSYPFRGVFDLIVCRNVMIYFDLPTKQNLLKRFHRYMENGAYLFTGHAESLTTFDHLFKRIQVAIYRK